VRSPRERASGTNPNPWFVRGNDFPRPHGIGTLPMFCGSATPGGQVSTGRQHRVPLRGGNYRWGSACGIPHIYL